MSASFEELPAGLWAQHSAFVTGRGLGAGGRRRARRMPAVGVGLEDAGPTSRDDAPAGDRRRGFAEA